MQSACSEKEYEAVKRSASKFRLQWNNLNQVSGDNDSCPRTYGRGEMNLHLELKGPLSLQYRQVAEHTSVNSMQLSCFPCFLNRKPRTKQP